MNKVYAVYFSATGTTKKSCVSVAERLGKVNELDFTVRGTEQEICFDESDIVVIGGPVYGGRIYKGAMERFAGLKGNNTPCVILAVYGNRDYDDSLVELFDFMKERGFVVIAAAGLVAEHTYGNIQIGRPYADDIAENHAFGEKIAKKLSSGDFSVPEIKGNRPYKDGGNGGAFRPLTNDKCTECGKCKRDCPEHAIEDDLVTINSNCIACFRCIKTCSSCAKNMDIPQYNEFAASFSERLSSPRSNEYFI